MIRMPYLLIGLSKHLAFSSVFGLWLWLHFASSLCSSILVYMPFYGKWESPFQRLDIHKKIPPPLNNPHTFSQFCSKFLRPFAGLYLIWFIYDFKTPCRGSRPSEFVYNLPIWKRTAEYFPIEVHKTAEIPPDRNYIFWFVGPFFRPKIIFLSCWPFLQMIFSKK